MVFSLHGDFVFCQYGEYPRDGTRKISGVITDTGAVRHIQGRGEIPLILKILAARGVLLYRILLHDD